MKKRKHLYKVNKIYYIKTFIRDEKVKKKKIQY